MTVNARGSQSIKGWACLGLAMTLLATVGCQVDLRVRHLPPQEPLLVQVSAGHDGMQDVRLEPAMLIEGSRIFDERCAPCHGDTGQADGALAEVLPIKPRNYHEDEFKWGTTPAEIVRSIAGGRSDIMPAFAGTLTPREMWSVAYVVWSWIPEERRAPHPDAGSNPSDPGVSGSAVPKRSEG